MDDFDYYDVPKIRKSNEPKVKLHDVEYKADENDTEEPDSVKAPFFWEHEFGCHWVVQFLESKVQISEPQIRQQEVIFTYFAPPIEFVDLMAEVNKTAEREEDKVSLSNDLIRVYGTLQDFKGTIKTKAPYPVEHNYQKKEIVSKGRTYLCFFFKKAESSVKEEKN